MPADFLSRNVVEAIRISDEELSEKGITIIIKQLRQKIKNVLKHGLE